LLQRERLTWSDGRAFIPGKGMVGILRGERGRVFVVRRLWFKDVLKLVPGKKGGGKKVF